MVKTIIICVKLSVWVCNTRVRLLPESHVLAHRYLVLLVETGWGKRGEGF